MSDRKPALSARPLSENTGARCPLSAPGSERWRSGCHSERASSSPRSARRARVARGDAEKSPSTHPDAPRIDAAHQKLIDGVLERHLAPEAGAELNAPE